MKDKIPKDKVKELYRFYIEEKNQTIPGYPNIDIVLRTHEVLRTTPQGYWIRFGISDEKWVNDYSKKRFAYPTKEQAKLAFIKRKGRYKRILSYKLKVCELSLELIEKEWE